MKFSDLGLSPDILKAVDEAGYQTPTPIQEQAIPVALMGRDILGCAQTGTGKTAGFTLPMIEILASGRAKARMPRSIILEPTRELATQVSESFETYGKYHKKLSKALLIGGTGFADQERLLDRGVDVLIATPGRLIDLFERGKILLSDVKILVIDEADRMLDMGFMPDVERIVSKLPSIRQTLFFSATMPPEIRRLADAFLINPKSISVAPPATTADTVEQFVVKVGYRDKPAALNALIAQETPRQAIVFCNRKRDIGDVVKSLKRAGLNVDELHGDMSQHLRTRTMDAFREEKVVILVASDVAARGLDVDTISHVFNYDVPTSPDDYVHRIGRTGRAGRKGKSYTLATPDDERFLSDIERLISKKIPVAEVSGIRTPQAGDKSEESSPRESRHDERGRHRNRRERSPRGHGGGGGHKNAGEHRPNRSPERAERPPQARPAVTSGTPTGAQTGAPPRAAENESQSPARAFGDHTPAFLMRSTPFKKGEK